MYFGDHLPPHFHAEYSGHEALIDFTRPAVYAGKLPRRATALVLEWAVLHHDELQTVWAQAQNLQPLDKIEPLD